MKSTDELPEAMDALASSFGIDRGVPARAEHLTLDDVRVFVSENVARLLDRNPGMLMSILYRIDVAEPKVRRVLEFGPHDVMVERLTELIIERQLEKVRIRRRYRERDTE